MSEITFRTAVEADIPVILRLSRDGGIVPEQINASIEVEDVHLKAFATIDADPLNHLIVAMHEGEVVGSMQLSYIPGLTYQGGWRCMMENVHVRSDMRGTGVGTRMVEHGIAEAEKFGCFLVQLSSNKLRKDAHRFYERLGFVASHEGFKLTLN